MSGKFYLTTPIYYPSDRLHIGHAYTTVLADAVARWHRFCGRDVFFLTGSDEHGQKIERAARARGKEPQEHVDGIVATFQELWRRLEISYDDFIRTTEPRHKKVVQTVFQRLYEQGDIYKGAYEGWYCTPCETFVPEARLQEGKCPDCGREVERIREENYFFRLSRYADRLLAHIESHPDFILPETRRNEMVSFIKSGLEDLAVSRTTFRWGIPVPFDPDHVIYVWIDALTNYLTGIGYLQDDAQFQRYWPADVHIVGKDILRFHTIIWPCILMALGLPLPKRVYGHGWLISETGKMSKSKGNVVDPNLLMDEFGVDAIRYFLLREVGYGQDARWSRDSLIERINADLANDLGNGLYRTLAMLQRYFGGVVPEPGAPGALEHEVRELAARTVASLDPLLERLEVNSALAEIWRLVGRLNKYIDEKAPWALQRAGQRDELATTMYTVLEGLRIVTLLVAPFMPGAARKMWAQLGIAEPLAEQRVGATAWGGLRPGTYTRPGDPLFPRIQEEEETPVAVGAPVASAAARAPGAPAAPAAPSPGTPAAAAAGKAPSAPTPEAPAATPAPGRTEVSIEEFGRIELRVATILAAERVKGADKLLKLQVDLGGQDKRQIVAGIAKHYEPEALVGKQIVVVANLKPARLRGELSQGMLLAASTPDGELALVVPERPLPPGSQVR